MGRWDLPLVGGRKTISQHHKFPRGANRGLQHWAALPPPHPPPRKQHSRDRDSLVQALLCRTCPNRLGKPLCCQLRKHCCCHRTRNHLLTCEGLASRAAAGPNFTISWSYHSTPSATTRNLLGKLVNYFLPPKSWRKDDCGYTQTYKHKVLLPRKKNPLKWGYIYKFYYFFIPKIHINENLLFKCREAFAYNVVSHLHHKTFSYENQYAALSLTLLCIHTHTNPHTHTTHTQCM